MSIDSIVKVENLLAEIPSLDESINNAFDSIGFTSEYASSVLDSINQSISSKKYKQFKDDVWGMIEFHPSDLVLIDSPVFQRLRGIKQLGFSSFVYHTAEHSRFSHSLGVAHVVNSFVESINRRAAREAERGTDQGLKFVTLNSDNPMRETELRHAALLHDIGHFPFSHVTEKIIERSPKDFHINGTNIKKIKAQVFKILKKNPKLSELFSIIIILSSRFREFYIDSVQVAGNIESDRRAAKQSLYRICCLILGLPPTEREVGLPDLISSSTVDADRIDYISRDSKNCGIPVGIDTARLFLRSGLLELSKLELEKYLGKTRAPSSELHFVVNSSGSDTIEELMLARTSLYQRIYYHPITRSLEAMLSKSLMRNVKADNPSPDLLDALQIWRMNDYEIIYALNNHTDESVRDVGKRIVSRTLPKKAYAFCPSQIQVNASVRTYIEECSPDSEYFLFKLTVNAIIDEFLRDKIIWKDGRSQIRDKITEEANKIVGLLKSCAAKYGGDFDKYKDFDERLLEVFVVGTQSEESTRKDQIVCQNDRIFKLHEMTNTREQQDASHIVKDIGFILCPEQFRSVVFYASRKVLSELRVTGVFRKYTIELKEDDSDKLDETVDHETRRQEGIFFVPRFMPTWEDAVQRCNLNLTAVEELEEHLTHAGYFRDAPQITKSVEEDERVRSVVSKLETFRGYRNWKVTNKSVSAFCQQFPPEFRDEVLDALNNILVLNKSKIYSDMRAEVATLGGGAVVAPFTPSSGTEVCNWLRKELADGAQASFKPGFGSAIMGDRDFSEIVLVDDNASSATQARAQFLNFFGIPRDDWPEQCRDEQVLFDPLSEEEINKLETKSIHLLVHSSLSTTEEIIRRDVGFDRVGSFSYKYISEMGDGFEWSDDLKSYLMHVGQQLYAWSKFRGDTGWDYESLSDEQKDKSSKNSLGYHNVNALICTPSSVPTATVSAIWSPGIVDGRPWVPLLIRNNKLKHAVF